MNAPAARRLAEVLGAAASGADCFRDPQSLARASCDALFEGPLPLAVLRPRTIAMLSKWVTDLGAAQIPMVPQGSCLSYSGGTTAPADGAWVALDMRALDRVIEIDAVDRFVRVEGGCTWATLRRALCVHGLRTPFWGPASGLSATVGGSLAADAIFLGSATYGSSASTVTGITLLLSDGQLLRTGVSVSGLQTLAHPFGPDLTGLCVGSCGAFGIIVEATLSVIADPTYVSCAGFGGIRAAGAMRLLHKLAAADLCSEVLMFYPGSPNGCNATNPESDPADPLCSVHVAVEDHSEVRAEAKLATVRHMCASEGALPTDGGLLESLRKEPFGPPEMLLDPHGRRWVPVHGLVRHSQVAAALGALARCMERHAVLVGELGLQWHYTCALIGAASVLVEINLQWPDGGNALLESHLGARGAVQVTAAPSRWKRVQTIRTALAEALADVGASHLQIGRFYRFLSRLDPTAHRLLQVLKAALDPHSIMNPGVLGLGHWPVHRPPQTNGGKLNETT